MGICCHLFIFHHALLSNNSWQYQMRKAWCIFANSDTEGEIVQRRFDFKEAQAAVSEPPNSSKWLPLEKKATGHKLSTAFVKDLCPGIFALIWSTHLEAIGQDPVTTLISVDFSYVVFKHTLQFCCGFRLRPQLVPIINNFTLVHTFPSRPESHLVRMICFPGVLELKYIHCCKISFAKAWLNIFCILTPKYLLHPPTSIIYWWQSSMLVLTDNLRKIFTNIFKKLRMAAWIWCTCIFYICAA